MQISPALPRSLVARLDAIAQIKGLSRSLALEYAVDFWLESEEEEWRLHRAFLLENPRFASPEDRVIFALDDQ